MTADTLPTFTEHDGNMKRLPLDDTRYGKPDAVVVDFLAEAEHRFAGGKPRVLDVGCGRGSRVAWLLDNGWDAFGCEIVPAYLAAAEPYFVRRGWGRDRLRLVADGGMPFDPSSFDVILSDQVIEHVENLNAFAEGIASVSRSGALGLHVFPATWRPVEPHLKSPVVHWLPKGRVRRLGIETAMRAGLAANHFSEYSFAERVEIFSRYSDTETFYRSQREVRRTFERFGMRTDMRSGEQVRVRVRYSWLPPVCAPAAGRVYGFAGQTYLRTEQQPS